MDVVQLSKDIAASRKLTIAYNERVLNGIVSASEYQEHTQHHKELAMRVAEWRDTTRHLYTAHGKRRD